MLKPDLPVFNDVDGQSVPSCFSRVIDTHVHIFPHVIFQAVRQWFDQYGWDIRYRERSRDLIQFLLDRGVDHVVALQYAHKPGMAGFLNDYMASVCREFPGRVSGLATLFPGEDQTRNILEIAFAKGLKGVKLHAHVQCFDMVDPALDDLYATCLDHDMPLNMHVGTEPKSDQYKCDPYEICRYDKVERVLNRFPGLKLCVPHLGVGEIPEYAELIEKYDTLYLDTAMAITNYFPLPNRIPLSHYRLDRVMYGSDYPNIPYAWDRELKFLANEGLSQEELDLISHGNAQRFFGIDPA
ncbi:MAG: amidohydrolase family protein [Desulfobacterales bacterium]|nr:amidohydrolase family protein [Desulfobacterales bacterium]